jgi:FAD/FMN-containing dehydrogenase
MSLASLPQIAKPAVDAAALREELTRAIAGEVRFERLDRAIYSTDASVYQIVPVGIVLPKTADDVSATLRICARHGVPIETPLWYDCITG